MTETFAALLCAHMLADFPFQTDRVARGKGARDPRALAFHVALHLGLAVLALGTVHWALIVLAAVHLAIDLGKSFAPEGRLWPFLADQAAHVVSLLVAAALFPALWSQGLWAGLPWQPAVMALIAGFVAATVAGGYAVKLLLDGFIETKPDDRPDDSLKKGGELIGRLERGLIFLLVLVGQPAGIGFLIAAKSILRFEATRENPRSASEYIIIGTLASFGWAMAVSWVTLALLSHLAPIGIPPATP